MSVIPVILAFVSALLLLWASFSHHWLFGGGKPDLITLAYGSVIDISVWMRCGVSVIVLVAALYVILNQSYGPDDKKWGYGIVGTIVGYWLRGAGTSNRRLPRVKVVRKS
jgi:hypothetical protein